MRINRRGRVGPLYALRALRDRLAESRNDRDRRREHISTNRSARSHRTRPGIGDGGAHLHVWFFARPEGQAQLFGSWLVVWDDLLPEYPSALAEKDAAAVADALVASYGGRRGTTAG